MRNARLLIFMSYQYIQGHNQKLEKLSLVHLNPYWLQKRAGKIIKTTKQNMNRCTNMLHMNKRLCLKISLKKKIIKVDQWQCWKWAGLQTLEYKARLPHYTNYPLHSPPLHPSYSHSAKKKPSTHCWFWERRQWLRALPERDRTISEMDIRIVYINRMKHSWAIICSIKLKQHD